MQSAQAKKRFIQKQAYLVSFGIKRFEMYASGPPTKYKLKAAAESFELFLLRLGEPHRG